MTTVKSDDTNNKARTKKKWEEGKKMKPLNERL